MHFRRKIAFYASKEMRDWKPLFEMAAVFRIRTPREKLREKTKTNRTLTRRALLSHVKTTFLVTSVVLKVNIVTNHNWQRTIHWNEADGRRRRQRRRREISGQFYEDYRGL